MWTTETTAILGSRDFLHMCGLNNILNNAVPPVTPYQNMFAHLHTHRALHWAKELYLGGRKYGEHNICEHCPDNIVPNLNTIFEAIFKPFNY